MTYPASGNDRNRNRNVNAMKKMFSSFRFNIHIPGIEIEHSWFIDRLGILVMRFSVRKICRLNNAAHVSSLTVRFPADHNSRQAWYLARPPPPNRLPIFICTALLHRKALINIFHSFLPPFTDKNRVNRCCQIQITAWLVCYGKMQNMQKGLLGCLDWYKRSFKTLNLTMKNVDYQSCNPALLERPVQYSAKR